MKLLHVAFKQKVAVDGKFVEEIDSTPEVPLSYDPQTDMIVVGNDGYEINRDLMRTWRRQRSTAPQMDAQCELCQRKFNDRRALGAHQRHAHGIKGQGRVGKTG